MKLRTLLEAVNQKMKLSDLVAKYKMKKVRHIDYTSYICTTPKGQEIFDIYGTAGDYRLGFQHRSLRKIKVPDTFKTVGEIDAFLEKNKDKLQIEDNVLTDDEVIKWLSKELSTRIKPTDFKDWSYIKWPKSIEIRDAEVALPYNQFIEGMQAYDDDHGLGEISMSLAEFEAWLVKNGVKKSQKPKRSINQSMYD